MCLSYYISYSNQSPYSYGLQHVFAQNCQIIHLFNIFLKMNSFFLLSYIYKLPHWCIYSTNVQTITNAPYPIPNCEVKRYWGDLVLWWVTTWETSTDVCKIFFCSFLALIIILVTCIWLVYNVNLDHYFFFISLLTLVASLLLVI